MNKVLLIIALNLIIVVAEVLFGILSNSMALIADALHNFGDVVAVVITFIALYFGQKSASLQMTFGYHRAEMMAAFLNGLFLLFTMFFLIYEAVLRLIDPPKVEARYVIVVAFVALLANALSAYLLQKSGNEHHHGHDHHHGSDHEHDHEHHHHGDMNIRAAFLHMLSDALISFAVVAGGVIIFLYDIYIIDPVLTLLFSLYIIYATFPLVKKSFWSLMDSHTKDLEKIIEEIQALEEVEGLSDVHLTIPSSKMSYFSAHLQIKEGLSLQEIEILIERVASLLLKKFGINHVTLQPTLKAENDMFCKGTHV